MTLAASSAYTPYTGDGIVDTFIGGYSAESEDHITVLLDNEPYLSFQVEGNVLVPGAWQVVLTDPPALGVEVLVMRDTPLVQATTYPRGGRYQAEQHGRDFDHIMRVAQEIRRDLELVGGIGSTLRADLANYTDDAKGHTLVAYVKNQSERDNDIPIIKPWLPWGDFERYGGDPLGIEDSRESVEWAALASNHVKLHGQVRVGDPIRGRSGVWYQGEGASTRVFNADATSAGSGLVFVMGTFGTSFCDGTAGYVELDNVTRGNDHVVASTAAEAAEFSEGELVWAWSTDGYTTGSGFHIPAFQQITEVMSVDAITGAIKFRDRVYKDGSNMRLSSAAMHGGHLPANSFVPQLVKNVTISDMTVESADDAWMRFGGMYRCVIRDLWINDSNSAFSVNGASHCKITRINASGRIRGIELAMMCHDVEVDEVDFALSPDASASVDLGVVTFAEGAHHNRVSRVRADYGDDASALYGVEFGNGSLHNEVHQMYMRSNAMVRAISAANAQTGMDFGHNVVADSVFDAETVAAALIGVPNSVAVDAFIGLTVRDSIFKAETLTTGLFGLRGESLAFIDNDFSGCPADPASTVSAGSSRILVRGNRLPGGANVMTFLERNDVQASGNTLVGRDLIEYLRLKAGSTTAIVSTSAGNAVDSYAIPGASLVAQDSFKFHMAGAFVGTDTHTLRLTYGGTVVFEFASTTAGDFVVDGTLTVLGGSVDTWKGDAVVTLGGTPANVRTEATQVTSADADMEIRAFVSNAASNIELDVARVEYCPRY